MLRTLLATLVLSSLAACSSPRFPMVKPAADKPAADKPVAAKPVKLSSALAEMAKNGKRDRLARALTKQPEQLTAGDDKGLSLLHIAASNNHDSLCAELVAAGLPLEARDEAGRTALAEAVWNGNSQVIRILLEKGADAKVLDNDGASVLHLAAPVVRPIELKMLIAAGADGKAVDKNGRSALHEAAAHRRPEFIPLLVEAGVGISIVPRLSRPIENHPTISVVPILDPVVRRTVGIIERRTGQLSRAASKLRALLFEDCGSGMGKKPHLPKPALSPGKASSKEPAKKGRRVVDKVAD